MYNNMIDRLLADSSTRHEHDIDHKLPIPVNPRFI